MVWPDATVPLRMSPPSTTPTDLSFSRVEWLAMILVSIGWSGLLAIVGTTIFEGIDYPRYFGPYAEFLRAQLLEGTVPWWNPYASLGRPFAIDLQVAFLYPTTLLNLMLGVRPGFSISLGLHSGLALAGMVLLARSLGAKRSAAWVGAIVLLVSGPFLARFQAGSLNLVFGYCYLPLILFLVLRLVTQPSRQNWVKLGGGLGLATPLQSPPGILAINDGGGRLCLRLPDCSTLACRLGALVARHPADGCSGRRGRRSARGDRGAPGSIDR